MPGRQRVLVGIWIVVVVVGKVKIRKGKKKTRPVLEEKKAQSCER
jgi:hypothetical protein